MIYIITTQYSHLLVTLLLKKYMYNNVYTLCNESLYIQYILLLSYMYTEYILYSTELGRCCVRARKSSFVSFFFKKTLFSYFYKMHGKKKLHVPKKYHDPE